MRKARGYIFLALLFLFPLLIGIIIGAAAFPRTIIETEYRYIYTKEKQSQNECNCAKAFEITDEERRIVECVVMGEAGGESYAGKALVAQCILNACEKDNIEPSEVIKKYQYSGWNDEPSEEVKQAVADVFDKGKRITDERILYFYAPKYCNSEWHESQKYIMTEGGHKFFAEWE